MERRYRARGTRWERAAFGAGVVATLVLTTVATIVWLLAAAFEGIVWLPFAFVPFALAVWLAYVIAGYGSGRRGPVLATTFVGAVAMLAVFGRVF